MANKGVVFESVDWFIPAEDERDMPQYRLCAICLRGADDDVIAGVDLRAFVVQHGGGCYDGHSICERCLEEHLKGTP